MPADKTVNYNSKINDARYVNASLTAEDKKNGVVLEKEERQLNCAAAEQSEGGKGMKTAMIAFSIVAALVFVMKRSKK